MSIKEYNTIYLQRLHRLVEEYVARKYEADRPIMCFFVPYHVHTNEGSVEATAHCFDTEFVMLSREDYTTLLFAVVRHHGMTFQELPLYISPELYRHIIESFSILHVYESDDHPCALEVEADPMGVSMTTLMEDAKKIIDDEVAMIGLQSCNRYKGCKSASVHVEIWMGIMEVTISCEKTGNRKQGLGTITHKDIYGMIDANAVLSALKVEKCKEVADALWRLFEEFAGGDESDITWLIRWLDKCGIQYTHAEGTFLTKDTEYRYKYKEIEL